MNKSDRINLHNDSTFILKGFLYYFNGELVQAKQYFQTGKDQNRNSMIALIGKACINFINKKYSEALRLFKKVLQDNPKVPGVLRLAMGYCYFYLR
jgi:RNA polymerase-associated protein CTR9